MQLTVVILNYNVCHFLHLCLQSVQSSIKGLNAEIIVVDNNSSDASCEMVKTCFPLVTLIENKKNVGFAKANNQAVAIAKGLYVCILNPDTVVPETVFINTLQKAQILPNLGVLGVQLIDGKGRFLLESKRNLPTPKVSICKVLGEKYQEYAPYYANHISADDEGKATIFAGAFMLLKTSIYKQVGGFDERYFMYGEDIDLSYTIEKAGYQNYYYGSEKVIHFKGESTFKDAKYRKRFFGAMKLFYKKHFKASIITNSIIYTGIKLASLFKKTPSKELGIGFKKGVVLSKNKELLNQIQQKIGISTSLTTVNQVYSNTEAKEPRLCFLDMSEISYSQAILLIQSNSNSSYYFRFIPEKGNIALGSDTSTGRGQVISL